MSEMKYNLNENQEAEETQYQKTTNAIINIATQVLTFKRFLRS